jgi:succinate dehydrogenase / fumarate reductase membrane anchor subunit
MRTPLGRVRGLGSARSGTHEHVAKQFSGFILALLTPYVVVLLIIYAGKSYNEVITAMRSMWVAPPLLAFILVSTYHMYIGMRVVIEDYVHSEGLKLVSMAANWIFSAGLAVVCSFAVLRLFLAG